MPRNTNPAIHAAFGEWFLARFGVDYRRRALICTGNINIARGYLTPSNALIELTPVGPFSLCFSPTCLDLYGHFQFAGRDLPENIAKLPIEMEQLGFLHYINDGLAIAAGSGHEVMVYADIFAYRVIS